MNKEKIIIKILKSLGFPLVGFLKREDTQLGNWVEGWIDKGFHGEMEWIERNREIRRDPCSIIEVGRSLITMAIPYNTPAPEDWKDEHLISNYAWGEDYHKVIKKRLKTALSKIKEHIPDFEGRAFTDSAPLAEKILAAKSGLGWIGKNSLLINEKFGSYIFLAEIVCNQELESTQAAVDRCGTCRLCISACPTAAINEQLEVDSNKCISYLTIEKRGEFNEIEQGSLDYQIFGCDLCQQICPWNRKAPYQEDSPFNCFDRWSKMMKENLHFLLNEDFEKLKQKSPIKRAKKEGFFRNIQTVINHSIKD
ncbi:MAG: tRNA epoxyqueuosine(34) reductase QueG [Proteobacteria bacterium]|nr:tRNA epoxyqueuosine(34) reductase QueG [Pseudomonadota bacterium]